MNIVIYRRRDIVWPSFTLQVDMQMSEDEGDEDAQSNIGEDEVNDEEELSEKDEELEDEVGRFRVYDALFIGN